jgi:hypothetical protein
MNKDFPTADKYYQQALTLCAEDRLKEPLTERHWLFLECDRARGLAQNNVKDASEALLRASESWKNVSSSDVAEFQSLRANPRNVAEIEYSLAAAKVSIAKANSDDDPVTVEQMIKDQEELKSKNLQLIRDNKASPLKLKEVLFLP